MQYIALIIENGKARQAECCGRTPADALLCLVMAGHIRKGATVKLGCAYWEGDNFISHVYEYHHMLGHDLDFASAWELEGISIRQYITAKPE